MTANFTPNCAAPSFECNTTIDAVLVVSLVNAFKFIEHEKVRSPQTGSALLCNRYHVPCFTDRIRPSTRRIKALSGIIYIKYVVWEIFNMLFEFFFSIFGICKAQYWLRHLRSYSLFHCPIVVNE